MRCVHVCVVACLCASERVFERSDLRVRALVWAVRVLGGGAMQPMRL